VLDALPIDTTLAILTMQAMGKRTPLVGKQLRKLQPKLRMVANGREK